MQHHVRVADLVPGSLGWRLNVAVAAHRFFGLPQSPEILNAIGKALETGTIEPLSIVDFSKYLGTQGFPAPGNVSDLTGIITAMERAGHLLPFGAPLDLPFMGQRYVAQGGAWGHQIGGNLWLSDVFGAELIIRSYNYVTVQICGNDTNGEPRWGTGLAVNGTHVITNKHVIANLDTTTPVEIHPSQGDSETCRVNCQSPAHVHPDMDVAVIEAHLPEGKSLRQLPGLAFRDPSWVDEVYLFGYPHVPMTTEMAITVQRGQVVNPAAESPAGGDLPRQKIFLYSAIARPGNSGGPIVAQDGRVVGLVVEDSSPTARGCAVNHDNPRELSLEQQVDHLGREIEDLRAKTSAAPFYRGIPASEIVRALNDLGLSGLIELDQPL